MLSPNPAATNTWPITGDVPDLQAIVWEQMATIAANEALLHAYQENLNAAQATSPAGAPATATANSTGTTSLTLSNVWGSVQNGAAVSGNGVPTGTVIMSQQSGTAGGNGVYITNNPTTLSNITVAITPANQASAWPTPNDTGSLMLIIGDQSSIIRNQTGLLALYQDLLNVSETVPPGSGP